MPNADKLWNVIQNQWPADVQWLTIRQVVDLTPQGTADITNRSSYDFAMLTMLSTKRRKYVFHQNPGTQKVLDAEIVKTNRNNGLWRKYLNSKICRKELINSI
jgi:hypothetical protein